MCHFHQFYFYAHFLLLVLVPLHGHNHNDEMKTGSYLNTYRGKQDNDDDHKKGVYPVFEKTAIWIKSWKLCIGKH